jgi:nicotinamide-nucleotide amidase
MRILPDEAALTTQAEALLNQCRRAGLTLATAESCTGGLIAATLTAIPGCSDVVAGGFVTYSNALKSTALGVPAALIASEGAVSEPVALAMAQGVLARTEADLAVAVTGIAGPGGGGPTRPVGLVWLAAVRRGLPPVAHRHVFAGDRQQVRSSTVAAALTLLAYCGGGAGGGCPPPEGPGPGSI